MKVLVRPFATLREELGKAEAGSCRVLSKELPADSCLRDLLEVLGLASVSGIVAVSKGKFLKADSLLYEGQEVALFPFLEGG